MSSEKDTQNEKPVTLVAFLVNDRPVAMFRDAGANERFLKAIDPDIWRYQARAHTEGLGAESTADRKHAATALRLVYGHGVETLLALLAAAVQAPSYPIGWMVAYKNRELREVISRIHQGDQSLPSQIRDTSWESLSLAIHDHVPPEPQDKYQIAIRFAEAWKNLAEIYLGSTFEPEYNSLKHGMRSMLGGFSVSYGGTSSDGNMTSGMTLLGDNEFGSGFWMPPRKVSGTSHTFELHQQVLKAWSPSQFISALELISASIRNVASRLLIQSGVPATEVQFTWFSEQNDYDAAWKHSPAVNQLSLGSRVSLLPEFREPSLADVLKSYRSHRDAAATEKI